MKKNVILLFLLVSCVTPHTHFIPHPENPDKYIPVPTIIEIGDCEVLKAATLACETWNDDVVYCPNCGEGFIEPLCRYKYHR